jgi:hypothetical protein
VTAFRIYLFHLSPGAEAIVATLRVGLGDADEERPQPREVILSAPDAEPRAAHARLLGLLERFHPRWRDLVTLSRVR